MITLDIKKREKKDNKKFKTEGWIPAVFYGKKEKSTPIAVKLIDFLKVLKEAGESTVITLEGEIGKKEALVYDIDRDPVTQIPRHADFYVFEKDHLVEVSIPINFTGVSPAVKSLGGTLVKVMYEIEIKAMPKDLPHEIEVNVENLVDFESKITVGDIKLPEGVSLTGKPEEIVILVEEGKEEQEEEVVSPDISSIEVEKKGKKEEPEQPVEDKKQESSKETNK